MKPAEELKKIAYDECIQMLGLGLVKEFQHLCGYSCGLDDDVFRYTMSLETNDNSYRASVIINPYTGEVQRNLKNSILPKGKSDETNNQKSRETI